MSAKPALRGLEQEGFIEENWKTQESGPAREVYAITPTGSKELAKRSQDWAAYRDAINGFIGGKSHVSTA